MVRDAEERAEEDKSRRELVENRNKLDDLIYRTEKSFKEFKDKLSEGDKKELEDALEGGKQVVKGDNLNEIQAAMERITNASHKMAELMYKQAAGGEAGDGKTQASSSSGEAEAGQDRKKDGGDDVIDAEFTEK